MVLSDFPNVTNLRRFELQFEAGVVQGLLKSAFLVSHDSNVGLSKSNSADLSSFKALPITLIRLLFRKNLFYLFPLFSVAWRGLEATPVLSADKSPSCPGTWWRQGLGTKGVRVHVAHVSPLHSSLSITNCL